MILPITTILKIKMMIFKATMIIIFKQIQLVWNTIQINRMKMLMAIIMMIIKGAEVISIE